MGRLNGKVIISPRLLMERGDQGKREPPAREKKRPLPQIGTAHTCTCPKHTQPCSHNTINIHIPFYADTPGVPLTPDKHTSILANPPPPSPEDTQRHSFTSFLSHPDTPSVHSHSLSLLLPISPCAAKPTELHHRRYTWVQTHNHTCAFSEVHTLFRTLGNRFM